MFTDLAEPELRAYRSVQQEPEDFDAFWSETLRESREAAWTPRRERVDAGLTTLLVYDVTFSGYLGDPVRAWLRLPRGARGPLPAVVQYVGYGGGRGHATDDLLWASAGFAHLTMDTRGQGSSWKAGATEDRHGTGPQFPGVMTRGIQDPRTYYYRRLYADAVLAVDAVRTMAEVDPQRVGVLGRSQGGGLALAAGALADDVKAVIAQVPFLCDFPRALGLNDEPPYSEITRFLAVHREEAATVRRTLAYFDGVNLARRGTGAATFSAGLMDATCPPSTVFGAFHEWRGPKEIEVWPFNGHEGGGPTSDANALATLRRLLT
ncbi:acetylxylan esterase [Microbacterium sp. NPDC028030]|uniref:acetylxylan esterase n=1 Tax=Microbacterium sp. NPDC028030 TaxID=3155124 RepID=UPI0033C84CA8